MDALKHLLSERDMVISAPVGGREKPDLPGIPDDIRGNVSHAIVLLGHITAKYNTRRPVDLFQDEVE